jgi:DNA-binding NarL/FixJ family response regulator
MPVPVLHIDDSIDRIIATNDTYLKDKGYSLLNFTNPIISILNNAQPTIAQWNRAIDAIPDKENTIVILDMSLRNPLDLVGRGAGFKVLDHVERQNYPIKILVYTSHLATVWLPLLAHGRVSYLQTDRQGELPDALNTLKKGNRYADDTYENACGPLHEWIGETLNRRWRGENPTGSLLKWLVRFSAYNVPGITDEEIAKIIPCNPATVSYNRANLNDDISKFWETFVKRYAKHPYPLWKDMETAPKHTEFAEGTGLVTQQDISLIRPFVSNGAGEKPFQKRNAWAPCELMEE